MKRMEGKGGRKSRAQRAASVATSAAALLATMFAPPAAAQSCVGDCNGNRTVTVEELVRAVNLALGSQTAGSCPGLDASGDGAVTVDELVAAVDNAVNGCPSSIRSTARAAARVAITSVTSLAGFGRVDLRLPQAISAAGSGGAPGTGTAGGAQQFGCDTRDCPLGGTARVCCLEGEFSIDQAGCTFRDDSGSRIEQSGFRRLSSADPNVCSGQIPAGFAFFLEATNFLESNEDSLGNVSVLVADFRESFDPPVTPGCALAQPDPLGFAIRGEGTHTIDGSVRWRVRSASGDVSEDTAAAALGLSIDVELSAGETSDCVVEVGLDGGVEVTDFGSGERVSQAFDLFGLTETPRLRDFLLEYDGSITTDCLGEIDVLTDDTPIRFVPDQACPVGGILETDLEDGGTLRILYTGAGGVRLDYGADDTVEEQLPSCAALARRECPLLEPEGQCASCRSFGDCAGTLVCTPCVTCETEQSRCIPFEGVVFCGDDLYADFGNP